MADKGNVPIKSEAEYDAALAAIDRLMGAEKGTPEAVELETLVSLVEAYEAAHWPVDREVTVNELRRRISRRPTVKLSIPPAEFIRLERDSR